MVSVNHDRPDRKNYPDVGRTVLLLSPTPQHGTADYAEAVRAIRELEPSSEVIEDAGLWTGAKDWKENYRRDLERVNPAAVYVLTLPGGYVGKGIFAMWRLLSRSGVECAGAFFPPVEEGGSLEFLPDFGLFLVDAENLRRYAVPVAASTLAEHAAARKGGDRE